MPRVHLEYLNDFIGLDLSEMRVGAKMQDVSNLVTIRCPHCSTTGAFSASVGGNFQYVLPGDRGVSLWFGMRICPSPPCHRAVFVISDGSRKALTLPPETIDFDISGVPQKIAESLKEAILCLAADCPRGAALLARRTLEEICLDRGANGKDLKRRIEALGAMILVPKALIEAMDEIRLLGNDAAHVEARAYDEISQDEARIAIELCKELVKATYQYEGLLSRIRSLKRQVE